MPFRVFKTQNFVPTQIKLVVTAADTENRIVHELNAEPAAREYAAAIGLLPDDLGPFSFASYPLVVKVGGDYYCRSIRNMNPDGSLSFFCAIDEGLVFTVARPQDMLRSTATKLAEIDGQLGGIDFVLGFDCALRRLDAENRQIRHQMEDLYKRYGIVGFHTYGEQYNAMHLNQTLTGIAFGRREVRLVTLKDLTETSQFGTTLSPAEYERRIIKLAKINAALMQRVERSMEQQANAFSLFQTAIGLEAQVRIRTEELKNALDRLEQTNDELVIARDASDRANRVKTRFFTAVGHDLLQPLHAARLSLSALGGGAAAGTNTRLIGQIDNALELDRGAVEDNSRSLQARGRRAHPGAASGAADQPVPRPHQRYRADCPREGTDPDHARYLRRGHLRSPDAAADAAEPARQCRAL